MVKERGVGRQTREMDSFMKLPASLSNNVKQVTVSTAGSGDLPASMSPLLEADEVRALHQLSRDIEEKLKIPLNLEGAGNRGLKEARSEPGTKMKILVVGASNAERLALELEQKPCSITRIITTNWRPALSGAVPDLVKQIEEAMAVSEPEVVVFEMLDNLLYMGKNQEGETRHSKWDKHRVYHVVGDLIMASKESQLSIYRLLKPIFMAIGSKPFLLITPFPRYMFQACCEDQTHVSNLKNTDFGENMLSSLEDIRTNFRGFLFSDNLRRVTVLNPTPILEKLGRSAAWGSNPVHPNSIFYTKLADLSLVSIETLRGKRRRESMEEDARGGGPATDPEWRRQSAPGHWTPRGRGYWPRRGRGGMRPPNY